MTDLYRPYIRPRRNRKSNAVRKLVRETSVSVNDLIAPLFLIDGKNKKEEISSMPGQYRLSPDLLIEEIKSLEALGVNCVCLFPALDDRFKDPRAQESMNPHGLYPKTLKIG